MNRISHHKLRRESRPACPGSKIIMLSGRCRVERYEYTDHKYANKKTICMHLSCTFICGGTERLVTIFSLSVFATVQSVAQFNDASEISLYKLMILWFILIIVLMILDPKALTLSKFCICLFCTSLRPCDVYIQWNATISVTPPKVYQNIWM